MRIVVQRVLEASVQINGAIKGSISSGLVVLLGIQHDDTEDDINWLVSKLVNLRVFNDENGKMNQSIVDVKGQFLVVSQFTLYASTKKGNRPSFVHAALPAIAEPLYMQFVNRLKYESITDVQTGEFGADMKVMLVNDGPVTLILDSKNKE
jgi:D-aminoacyl-tRNA deacylase